jgi:hypothetical protein
MIESMLLGCIVLLTIILIVFGLVLSIGLLLKPPVIKRTMSLTEESKYDLMTKKDQNA